MSYFKAFKTVMFAALLLLLIGAAFLFYQTRSDYYAKTSVDEAVRHAKHVLVAIRAEHAQTNKWPSSLKNLAVPSGQPGYVPTLALNGETGELTVEVSSDHGHFGTLFFTRAASTEGELEWRCRNGSVDVRLLPHDCRS